MPKHGVIIIHVLLIAFLVFAWMYRPPAASSTEMPAVSQPAGAAPDMCASAPTYTPLPTYTPYPTFTAAPTVAATSTPEPTATPDPFFLNEEFSGKLAPGWRLFNERQEGWNMDQPGLLELAASPGLNCCPDASWENLLLHPLPDGDYEVETKMFFTSLGGETAGLVLCEGPQSCFYHAKNPKYLPVEFVTKEAELTYLRVRREGNLLTCWASHDGVDWVEVSSGEASAYDMAGLAATQGDPENPSSARFDCFTIKALR